MKSPISWHYLLHFAISGHRRCGYIGGNSHAYCEASDGWVQSRLLISIGFSVWIGINDVYYESLRENIAQKSLVWLMVLPHSGLLARAICI